MFQGLLTHLLRDAAEARRYSVHSFRSYLCSALFAAKCSDAQIMACLRWSTQESVEAYKNVNPEIYCSWLVGAEQQRLTGMRLVNLATEFGRAPPITDNIAAAHAAAEPSPAVSPGGTSSAMLTSTRRSRDAAVSSRALSMLRSSHRALGCTLHSAPSALTAFSSRHLSDAGGGGFCADVASRDARSTRRRMHAGK